MQSLVSCASVSERDLLADTARIVEKNNICKHKDEFCRKIVTDGLLALGYDASICKSRWEKSPSCPAGTFSLSYLTKNISIIMYVSPQNGREESIICLQISHADVYVSNSSVMD